MAWIESHQSLLTHRKTGRLARKLGVSKVTAVGHLHCFWWWCMDNAPDGRLTDIDDEDIAEGSAWEGDPFDFAEALIFAGFCDRDPTGRVTVHNWYDYAGKLIEKRKADAERKRADRRESRPKDTAPPPPTPLRPVQQTSSGHPADGAGTVPNRTVPNLTQPNLEETHPAPEPPPTPVAPPDGGELVNEPKSIPAVHSTRFEAFWDAYPKKVGKKSCAAWWAKRRPSAELTQTILDSVEAHKHGDQWQRNFIKEPIRWLQEERWNDEVPPAPIPSLARSPASTVTLEDGTVVGAHMARIGNKYAKIPLGV